MGAAQRGRLPSFGPNRTACEAEPVPKDAPHCVHPRLREHLGRELQRGCTCTWRGAAAFASRPVRGGVPEGSPSHGHILRSLGCTDEQAAAASGNQRWARTRRTWPLRCRTLRSSRTWRDTPSSRISRGVRGTAKLPLTPFDPGACTKTWACRSPARANDCRTSPRSPEQSHGRPPTCDLAAIVGGVIKHGNSSVPVEKLGPECTDAIGTKKHAQSALSRINMQSANTDVRRAAPLPNHHDDDDRSRPRHPSRPSDYCLDQPLGQVNLSRTCIHPHPWPFTPTRFRCPLSTPLGGSTALVRVTSSAPRVKHCQSARAESESLFITCGARRAGRRPGIFIFTLPPSAPGAALLCSCW